MGLFDTIRSSFDLGEEFTNKECQTKDLDRQMDFYWISPDGKLWIIDEVGTHTLITEPFSHNFKWFPTGSHGKVTPVYLTGTIKIYYDHKSFCKIIFRSGIIFDWSFHKYQ